MPIKSGKRNLPMACRHAGTPIAHSYCDLASFGLHGMAHDA